MPVLGRMSIAGSYHAHGTFDTQVGARDKGATMIADQTRFLALNQHLQAKVVHIGVALQGHTLKHRIFSSLSWSQEKDLIDV